MRLVSFEGGFGRLEGESVVPMGLDLVDFLASGDTEDGEPVAASSVRLLAPVPRPPKIIGIGLNYRDHAAESGQPMPEEPILFAKFASSVIGPGEEIVVPRETTQPDYEAELGVVIGRVAKGVSDADALDYVAGYTCANDVSARDLQLAVSQWTRGKAVDTFLTIRCLVNGEVVQDSSTQQMVFSVAELVSTISRTLTLEPGDVIATGTPPGIGMARTPPRWLQDGDEVTVEIERLGALTNRVRFA